MAKQAPKAKRVGGRRKPLAQADCLEAYRVAKRYLRRSYVTGITIGEPIRRGTLEEGRSAICIHVEEKFPPRFVRKEQLLPKEILGVPVDVVERRHRPYELSDEQIRIRRIRQNHPLHPGVAISIKGGQPGTLGLFVYDLPDGNLCLLTANHVLESATSTTVVQPGSNMMGQPVATVTGGIFRREGDAAIARLNNSRSIERVPIELGAAPQKLMRVSEGQRLVKSGAQTGVTYGKVHAVGEVTVDYGNLSKGYLGKLTMLGFEVRPETSGFTGELSDGGDSGSVWLDADTGDAVGLCVGGDKTGDTLDEFSFACHLDLVFKELQISLTPPGPA